MKKVINVFFAILIMVQSVSAKRLRAIESLELSLAEEYNTQISGEVMRLDIDSRFNIASIEARFLRRLDKNKANKKKKLNANQRTKFIPMTELNPSKAYSLSMDTLNNKELGLWMLQLKIKTTRGKRLLLKNKQFKRLAIKNTFLLTDGIPDGDGSGIDDENIDDNVSEEESEPEEEEPDDGDVVVPPIPIEDPDEIDEEQEPVEDPVSFLITRISPKNGEADVALTRETIIEFNEPVREDILNSSAINVSFLGRALNLRKHLSPDAKTLTVFYPDNLPASAQVKLEINGDLILNQNGDKLDVDKDNIAGGFREIEFNTLSLSTAANTRICGFVFASHKNPETDENISLEGVTISVDAKESIKTLTDANGRFCLDSVPVGRFFVHINGKTAINPIPEGAYYPNVGKPYESIANQEVEIGNVFLPLISPNTLQEVSDIEDTEINFPQEVLEVNPDFAGVNIRVPANSLYSDDGTRGGSVGIAPVPSDRLPGTLPPGLNLPLVITVQTDGATNFDIPAPVCFPNLPDPVTGELLEAGTKSALWSFNHDTGKFEVAGPMTVTDDAKLVCSDQGFGVRAPGWHGSQPGTEGEGEADDEQEDFDPCEEHAGLINEDFPSEVTDALDANDAEIQSIDGESSDFIFDEYETNVEMPEGLSPEEFLSELAEDLSGVVDDFFFNSVNKFTKIPAGPAKLGDIYQIDLLFGAGNFSGGFAPGTVEVMITDIAPDHFTVTTINNGAVHPESGSRTFGFDNNPDGSVSFYTRGASRSSDDFTSGIFGPLKGNTTSHLQESTWKNWIKGIKNAIEKRGGQVLSPPDEDPQKTKHTTPDKPANCGAAASLIRNFLEAIKPKREKFNFNYRIDYIDPSEENPEFRTVTGVTRDNGEFSVILPGDVLYTIFMYDKETKRFATSSGVTENGFRTNFGSIDVVREDREDLDNDGLGAIAEIVFGTDPNKADSDSDGISDGAEIEQGLDPLDNVIFDTGLIASVQTPGRAQDLCVIDQLAAVADSAEGVTFVDISNIRNPILKSQINTPGSAHQLSCNFNRIAVADGNSGFAIIDINDRNNPKLERQIDLTDFVKQVEINNELLYVITSSRDILVYELDTGKAVAKIKHNAFIDSIKVHNGKLYVLTNSRLDIFNDFENGLNQISTIRVPGVRPPQTDGRKFFVDNEILYVGFFTGFSTYDISDPANPRLIGQPPQVQAATHDLAPNGSDLLVAVTSFAGDGTLSVSTFDISNPNDVTRFITSFRTPGIPRALELHDGLAYVADETGLQVVSYLSFDNKGIQPELDLKVRRLNDNFNLINNNQVNEGERLIIDADSIDDVQIARVEFFVNDELFAVDGSYPFEVPITVPFLNEAAELKLTVRASDTGLNTREETRTLNINQVDLEAIASNPVNQANAQTNTINSFAISFNKPVNFNTVNNNSVFLIEAGLDKLFDTEDDNLLLIDSFLEVSNGFIANLNQFLDSGLYKIRLLQAITDKNSQSLANQFESQFTIINEVPEAFWINPNGGRWEDPENWQNGILPGSSDNVIINLADPDKAISHNFADTKVNSIQSNAKLILNGGTLDVTETLKVDNEIILGNINLKNVTILKADDASPIVVSQSGPKPRFDNVTLERDLDFLSNTFISVVNNLTLNNITTLGRDSAIPKLIFENSQELKGNGVVNLLGSFAGKGSGLLLRDNVHLDIGEDITINSESAFIGSDSIGDGFKTMSFDNHGTINTIDEDSELTIKAGLWKNFGKININPGAELLLEGVSSYDNDELIGEININKGILVNRAKVELDGNIDLIEFEAEQFSELKSRNPLIINFDSSLDNEFEVAHGVKFRNIKFKSDNDAHFNLIGDRFRVADAPITLDNVIFDLNTSLRAIVIPQNEITVNKGFTVFNGGSFNIKTPIEINGSGNLIMKERSEIEFTQSNAELKLASGLNVRLDSARFVKPFLLLNPQVENAKLINEAVIDIDNGEVDIRVDSIINRGVINVNNLSRLTLETLTENTGEINFDNSSLIFKGNLTIDKPANFNSLIIERSNITNNSEITINENGNFSFANTSLQGGIITGNPGAEMNIRSLFNGQDVVLDNVILDIDTKAIGLLKLKAKNNLVVNKVLQLGAISNDQSITPADLQLDGDLFLGGTGKVLLLDNDRSDQTIIRAANDSTLTIGENLNVEGGNAVIGFTNNRFADNFSIINNGTISANINGQVLKVNAHNLINNGTIKSENGGIIFFEGLVENNGEISGEDSIFTVTSLDDVQVNQELGFKINLDLDEDFINPGLGSIYSLNLKGHLDNTNQNLVLDGPGPFIVEGGEITGGKVTAESDEILVIRNKDINSLEEGESFADQLFKDLEFDVETIFQASFTLDNVSFSKDSEWISHFVAFVKNDLTLNQEASINIEAKESDIFRDSINFFGDQSIKGNGSIKAIGFGELEAELFGFGSSLLIEEGVELQFHNGFLGSEDPNSLNTFINRGSITVDNGQFTIRGNGWINQGTIDIDNSNITFIEAFDAEDSGDTFIDQSHLILLNSQISNKKGWNLTGFSFINSEINNIDQEIIVDSTFDQFGVFDMTESILAGGQITMLNHKEIDLLKFNTFDNLIVNGDLNLTHFFETNFLELFNGLTLNGKAKLGRTEEDLANDPVRVANNLFGEMIFVGSQTLDGNADIVFGDEFDLNEIGDLVFFNSLTIQEENTTLTIGEDVLIHGSDGSIGQGPFEDDPENVSLVNNGTIFSDVPDGFIEIFAQDIVNNGVIKTIDEGFISIEGLTQNNGEISGEVIF